MGVERKVTRVFADVAPGFDPFAIAWQSQAQQQYAAQPVAGAKRIWLEIEIPADHEIWPEKYEQSVYLGRVGQRQIQVGDQNTPERVTT